MKQLRNLFLIYFSFAVVTAYGQHKEERIIRNLEAAERDAILHKDTVKLKQLMSPEIVVQNPENAIVGLKEIMDRMRTGRINYRSFDRNIESIRFYRNTAVVMGSEAIIPRVPAGVDEQMIFRRFTNIWEKGKGGWKQIGRQATIISAGPLKQKQ